MSYHKRSAQVTEIHYAKHYKSEKNLKSGLSINQNI